MGLVERGWRMLRRDGFRAFAANGVRFAFDLLIRPRLPRRTVTYNGVRVRADHRFDAFRRAGGDRPRYESGVIRGIRAGVRDGDRVVVVGGGWGVSSVVAARAAGPGGSVTTYEPSRRYAGYVRETAALNDVGDRIEVEHAFVADVVSMRGVRAGARRVPPEDLDDCDVLVMDCEGAEVRILAELPVEPRLVVVETHGDLGAPESDVADLLVSRGYDVVSRDVADASRPDHCERAGLIVLVAER